MKSFIAAAILLAGAVSAQSPLYGQCGGQSWTGPTTCVAGSTCTYSNPYYSQCLPGSTNPTTTAPGTTTKPPTSTVTTQPPAGTDSSGCSASRTKFKYFGVNQSCAEFGQGKYPGVLGTDYTWPTRTSVDFFMGKGFNTFRIAFAMERISPLSGGLTGSFDATYLAALKDIATYITGKGGYAVIDPHNYARYNNAVITNYAQFTTWWKNLAGQFVSNSHIIFDVNNEPNGISATDAFNLNQAGINGIRSSGATTQLILVEGTAWTGAWSWSSSGNAAAFTAIKDPNNNVAIEMHQYLDSDSSGTSATCVSSTVGVERLQAATAWLQANNLKGFLGEIGGGSNDVCIAAIKGALCHMQTSGGVWLGALWWAAGPWWGTYFQSMEPPSGAAVARILPEAWQPFL